MGGAAFTRCAPCNRIPGKHTGFESIHFGRSGGFTNITDAYLLVNSGMVYKVADGEFTGIRKLDKPEIRRIGQELQELEIGSLDLAEKGNMTYFLKIKNEDGEEQVTWTESTVHPGVKEFYRLLVSTLQSPEE
ncbi:MAG: hypothetical protein EHM46_06195 [Bacteroidetes bacterium]|nr:MAG: hypothetical protein EHM46_06195 [Bacteroidota bacterium]